MEEINKSELFQACKDQNYSLIKEILDAQPEQVNILDEENATCIYIASELGDVQMAKMLIAYGANINHQNVHGITPLIRACQMGHLLIVEFLLQNKAVVNHCILATRYTALMVAIHQNNANLVRILLKYKPVLDFCNIPERTTPLIMACNNNNDEIVHMLVSAGANIHYQDTRFRNAMSIARSNNNLLIQNILNSQIMLMTNVARHERNLLFKNLVKGYYKSEQNSTARPSITLDTQCDHYLQQSLRLLPQELVCEIIDFLPSPRLWTKKYQDLFQSLQSKPNDEVAKMALDVLDEIFTDIRISNSPEQRNHLIRISESNTLQQHLRSIGLSNQILICIQCYGARYQLSLLNNEPIEVSNFDAREIVALTDILLKWVKKFPENYKFPWNE